MSLQWMKRKAKGLEGKKENSKVNDRIQKLICDLKSKRESLAAVQTGFPSSVASFVTNTWMPSVHGGENKKRRWSYMRKKGAFNAKCPSDGVRGSRDLQSEISTEPQIGGQVSANLQSGIEVPEKIYTDPQSLGLFSGHRESEGLISKRFSATAGSAGQFGDDRQFVGQYRNDPQFVGQNSNDLQFLGQFGNDPEFVGQCGHDSGAGGEFGNGPRFVGQFGNDPEFVGQYGNDPEAGGELGNALGQHVSDSRFVRQSENDPEQFDRGSVSQSDRDPLSLQLGHGKNCEDQIVEEESSERDISAIISSIPESSARFCPFCKELLVVALVLTVSLSVVFDVKKTAVGVTAIVYFLVRVLFGKQENELKTQFFRATTSSVTILPSIWKWANDGLCRALCRNVGKSDAFTSNCVAIAPCSDSAKEGCEEIHCSKLLSSDVNKKLRQRRVLVQKPCLEVGAKGLKFSSTLGSSVLIVVLVGLLAGRFPAFLLALVCYFVLKLVQIVEQGSNIPSFHKGKRQLRYPR